MILIHWLAQNGLGLLAVVMSFGFLIFIHELGHFLMAKRVGVRVHEFALGLFGPQIIMVKRDKEKKWRLHVLPFLKKEKPAPLEAAQAEEGTPPGEVPAEAPAPVESAESGSSESDETEYSIRLIPMGGFVDMREDDAPADMHDLKHFQNRKIWEKIKIVACGPLMNYVTAILLFWFIGFVYGVGHFCPKPRIGTIRPGTPADAAGLKAGDYIIAIDGKTIDDGNEMIDIIHRSPEKELTLRIQRGTGKDTEVFEKKVTTILIPGEKEKVGMIGFTPDQKALDIKFTRAPAGTVILDGLYQTERFTVAPLYAFALIFKGKIKAKELKEGSAGPVGIGQMFFETYHKGFNCLLYFCAVVNVLIGCFNLLPIPPLDGFRIFLFAIEGIRGKALNQKHVGAVLTAGFFILMALVLFFTFNDIMRLVHKVTFF